MDENFIDTSYDITKKSKLNIFYNKYKILVFSILSILFILIVSVSFFLKNEENKKLVLSENYIKAKIYLENGEKLEALKILKKAVYANEPAYSTLAFFMVLNQDLIQDHNEISSLFNHLLENNKFDEEIRNLADEADKNCRKILQDNLGELHVVAKGLLEYETLTGDEIKDLIKGIKPSRDDFDDNITSSHTAKTSVPKTGGTTAPQHN